MRGAEPSPGAPLPPPPPEASDHSVRLATRIRAAIAEAGGSLSFARFMDLALYAPGLGYYSAGAVKFGGAGDFVTAPEISPVFAACLGRQVAEVLRRIGGGEVLEIGAGSGRLAVDLLQILYGLGATPKRYRILETSADLRERQQSLAAAELTPALANRLEWLDAWPATLGGVVLANEVLDAMPVHLFRVRAGSFRERRVVWRGSGFGWLETAPGEPRLIEALAALAGRLAGPLPEGYASEINLDLGPWLAALAQRLEAGLILLVDYGYPQSEYYHPDRASGTLVCHYRHRRHDDPLILPGLQDITASVDFTAVAEAAAAAGLAVLGYTTQAHFLMGCGLDEVMAQAGGGDAGRLARLAAGVKRLVMPGEMGERVKVLGLGRCLEGPLRGFRHADHRGRL